MRSLPRARSALGEKPNEEKDRRRKKKRPLPEKLRGGKENEEQQPKQTSFRQFWELFRNIGLTMTFTPPGFLPANLKFKKKKKKATALPGTKLVYLEQCAYGRQHKKPAGVLTNAPPGLL